MIKDFLFKMIDCICGGYSSCESVSNRSTRRRLGLDEIKQLQSITKPR
jgi:hypothetical protein